MVVETGSSTGSMASPKAPPAAPEMAASAVCRRGAAVCRTFGKRPYGCPQRDFEGGRGGRVRGPISGSGMIGLGEIDLAADQDAQAARQAWMLQHVHAPALGRPRRPSVRCPSGWAREVPSRQIAHRISHCCKDITGATASRCKPEECAKAQCSPVVGPMPPFYCRAFKRLWPIELLSVRGGRAEKSDRSPMGGTDVGELYGRAIARRDLSRRTGSLAAFAGRAPDDTWRWRRARRPHARIPHRLGSALHCHGRPRHGRLPNASTMGAQSAGTRQPGSAIPPCMTSRAKAASGFCVRSPDCWRPAVSITSASWPRSRQTATTIRHERRCDIPSTGGPA